MAGKKISELNEVTNPTDADEFVFVDKEGTGSDSGTGGKSAKITFANLKSAIGATNGQKGEPGEKGDKGDLGPQGSPGEGADSYWSTGSVADTIGYLGRVGIGTTEPAISTNGLHIQGPAHAMIQVEGLAGNSMIGFGPISDLTGSYAIKHDTLGDVNFLRIATVNAMNQGGGMTLTNNDLAVAGSISSSKSNDNDTLGESGIIVKSANPAITLLDTGSSTGVLLTAKSGGGFDIAHATEAEGKTSRFVISETGKVGIGTSNPDSVLTINHVHPQIRFEDADGDPAHVTQVGSYNGTLYFDCDMANPINTEGRTTGKGFVFRTDANTTETPSGNELLVINQNGNVGIGTDSPLGDLHIKHNTSKTEQSILIENDEGIVRKIIGTMSGANNPSLRFRANDTTIMTLEDSGIVGIGTTMPKETLDVNGTMRVGDGSYSYSDVTFATQPKHDIYEGVMGILPSVAPGSGVSQFATHFKTQVNADATGSTRHDVIIDGNVGIGTSTPNAPLVVSGQVTATRGDVYPLVVQTLDPTDYDMTVEDGVGIQIKIPMNGGIAKTGAAIVAKKDSPTDEASNTALAFQVSNDDAVLDERMRITSTGLVGINTTTPEATLEVNGTTRTGHMLYTEQNGSGYVTNQTISVDVPQATEGRVYHVIATRHTGQGNSQLRVAYLHYSANGTPFLVDSISNTGVNLSVSGTTVSVTNGADPAVLKLRILMLG